MNQTDTVIDKNIELTNQIAVERYKFILEKIKFLDSQYNGYLNLFIKLLTAMLSLILSSALIAKKGEIEPIWLSYILELCSLFVVLICTILIKLTSVTINSWREYRHDEVALLLKLNVDINRSSPSVGKEKHWNETAFIALLWGTAISFTLIYFFSDFIIDKIGMIS